MSTPDEEMRDYARRLFAEHDEDADIRLRVQIGTTDQTATDPATREYVARLFDPEND